MAGFEYVFPSIRGVQAGREHYISMCPMRLIPRIFLFDEEELIRIATFSCALGRSFWRRRI